MVPSSEMMSTCFNNLFVQLQLQRVNMDVLLLTWLTLNDEPSQDDATAGPPAGVQGGFDPTRVPSIPLSQAAVTSLLSALAWQPGIPVRTWVLAFQALSLMCNLRCPSEDSAGSGGSGSRMGGERWLATVMVADSNIMHVLSKFLSGTSTQGPAVSTQQFTQVNVAGLT